MGFSPRRSLLSRHRVESYSCGSDARGQPVVVRFQPRHMPVSAIRRTKTDRTVLTVGPVGPVDHLDSLGPDLPVFFQGLECFLVLRSKKKNDIELERSPVNHFQPNEDDPSLLSGHMLMV